MGKKMVNQSTVPSLAKRSAATALQALLHTVFLAQMFIVQISDGINVLEPRS